MRQGLHLLTWVVTACAARGGRSPSVHSDSTSRNGLQSSFEIVPRPSWFTRSWRAPAGDVGPGAAVPTSRPPLSCRRSRSWSKRVPGVPGSPAAPALTSSDWIDRRGQTRRSAGRGCPAAARHGRPQPRRERGQRRRRRRRGEERARGTRSDHRRARHERGLLHQPCSSCILGRADAPDRMQRSQRSGLAADHRRVFGPSLGQR